MRLLFFLTGTLLVFASTNSAEAISLADHSSETNNNPLRLSVGGKCTRLVRRNGRETLYNSCNTCRKVSVIRKRPGIPAPVRREFTLQGGAKYPVPFRGPGSTRITSDILCRGLPKPNPVNTPNSQKCVKLEQRPGGRVVLVNSCGTCRGVAVNRLTLSGRSLGLQAYKLPPLAVIRVVPKGADKVTLSAEVACNN